MNRMPGRVVLLALAVVVSAAINGTGGEPIHRTTF